jgi:hypothetical protein
MVNPSYTPDEIALRGDAVYDREVAPRTTERDAGRFVAIDVDSGAFGIASDELAAAHGLRARVPAARIWLRRVGVPYLHRFSPRPSHAIGARR